MTGRWAGAISRPHREAFARVVAALARHFGDLNIPEEPAAEASVDAVGGGRPTAYPTPALADYYRQTRSVTATHGRRAPPAPPGRHKPAARTLTCGTLAPREAA